MYNICSRRQGLQKVLFAKKALAKQKVEPLVTADLHIGAFMDDCNYTSQTTNQRFVVRDPVAHEKAVNKISSSSNIGESIARISHCRAHPSYRPQALLCLQFCHL